MKSAVIILFCVVALVALVESRAQNYDYNDNNGQCDSHGCMQDCYEQGLHGQCDPDDICRCYNCIYKACRRHCIRLNRIGQCDEANCLCL